MDQKKVGKIIKKSRKKKKISQKQLATILDVDIKCISKWENGKCLPYIEKLVSLCDTLDISYEEINYCQNNDVLNLKTFYILLMLSVILMISYKTFLFYIILTSIIGIALLIFFNIIKKYKFVK